MSDSQRVGWIGCGRMGSAMAKRLIEGGNELLVTNRTRSRAEELGKVGARVVDNPIDLAGCDVVFVMVSADAQLLQVLTGPLGVLASDEDRHRIVVDCSTVSPGSSASAREACSLSGADFLAAPVSGNPSVVTAGRLTLAVSGPQNAFDRVRPLLDQLGDGVTYVGEGELARLVKICHNMFLGVVTQAMAEITVLAQRGGIERSAFLEFLNDSVMGSTFTRYKTPAFVNLEFKASFTPVLLRKDFDLGMDEAKHLGVPMPVSSLCSEIVANAIGAGYADDDFAVLLLEQARSAGLHLESENKIVDDGLGVMS